MDLRRRVVGNGLLVLFLLTGALASSARTRSLGSHFPQDRSVIVWSADSVIGPVYYPADAPADGAVRQTAEDLARILGLIAQREWVVAPEPAGVVTANGIFVGETLRARLDGVGAFDQEAEGALDRCGLARYFGNRSPDVSAFANLDRTEVAVRPGRLVLNGESPSATRLGVYRFLQEKLGVLWVQPGPEGEWLPHRLRFALAEGRRVYQPFFWDRRFHLATGVRASTEDRLWSWRNGGSDHFRHNHGLHRIFTEAVLTENADWRAERSGRRADRQFAGSRGAQPDLTNPAVIDFAVEAIRRDLADNPDQLTFPLGTNDSTRYDDSAATREIVTPFAYHRGRPVYSDLVFGFTEEVARNICDEGEIDLDRARGHPLLLTQLAYMWTEPPPSFPLSPNILPYLCTDKSQWYDSDYRREDSELMRQWSVSGPMALGSWEYYEGQPFLAPRIFLDVQAESMRAMADLNVRALFFEGIPIWGFDGPKMWLAAQLAWDPYQDEDALLDEYFAAAYGPAAEPMRSFFEQSEAAWMEQPGSGFWLKYWLNPDQFALFSGERRKAMSKLLEAGRASVANSDSPRRAQWSRLIDRTAEAWRVATAAADVYDAWRALPPPPVEPVVRTNGLPGVAPSFDAFNAAQEAWCESAADASPRAWRLTELLTTLDPAQRWRDLSRGSWRTVFEDDFRKPVLRGDPEQAGPEGVPTEMFAREWSMIGLHAEDFRVEGIRSDAVVGYPDRVRVENAEYFSLFQWFRLGPDAQGEFWLSADLRGQISPGGTVALRLYFRQDEKILFPIHQDRWYPGSFPDWVRLAVSATPPEEATHVSIDIQIGHQQSGDWLEISQISLSHEGTVVD